MTGEQEPPKMKSPRELAGEKSLELRGDKNFVDQNMEKWIVNNSDGVVFSAVTFDEIKTYVDENGIFDSVYVFRVTPQPTEARLPRRMAINMLRERSRFEPTDEVQSL